MEFIRGRDFFERGQFDNLRYLRAFTCVQELFGHKWTKIADLLETRTAAQVKSFSRKFLKQKVLAVFFSHSSIK